MRAFVTGGTGFIGSHLADRLMEENAVTEVRCLVRNREKWLRDKSYTKIEGDLADTSVLTKALEGVDVLFHAAALVKAPTREEYKKANVDATVNIVRIAAERGVKKIVILSSLAAAGPSSGRPLTEEDPLRPISMYGESKKNMEQSILNTDTKGLSISILRPPAVYGPRENQIYTWFRLVNKGICPIVGDGKKPQLSMIYISDLIDGIWLAANESVPGVRSYFITGPDINNWNQIKNISSKVLARKPVPLYIRPGWVRQLAGLVESTASAFGAYPVFNREKANEMVLEWTCTSDKAAAELHYIPKISLETGISQTIHWYKKNNWL
ncbi:MAG: NAD(P)-dependent oxidoreductase [Balneolaceae bacterium]